MNDRPTASELLEAVRRFLAEEALPALDGPLGYQARVAANLVAIVAREIESEAAHLETEWRGLASLFDEQADLPTDRQALRSQILAWNQSLGERIRAGEADADPFRQAVFDHLKRTVDCKLAVARGPRR
ncbi:MAG: DUF6285 domain-containing protein [Myxococcota bacterium]|nr:DUF6285 domain-containing protein [Myxococcota bacterium]